ncbi:helix-turn-helix domain-containing protein [Streptomyces neyagawaensis]|uniref:helix-turn-helix domain-containing protein n=2 Tax=Streptomyces neyagawaensis TaxID=42238 RepID=UPI00201CECE4|nr:helix-turn-helix domain-containing protein [Streptomyces neyagawaensis]MCL6733330.1 helix-turn-helix domain-containing protein [Streptomyces neyagawaensis]MDE1685133.1 helix-turn-helix domain-containing protein [Streptomyces neyagawaensis]
MTAPTAPRVPNPGDLARRPAPQPAPARPSTSGTLADQIAPGRLHRKERMRTMFHHGLRYSRMHPEARLVALTLLGYAHHKTGMVFPRFQPTAEQLAEDTGLTAGQVQVQIHVLTQRGWLCTRRVTQGLDAGREGLSLAIPALVLEQVRAVRDASLAEPVTETD